MILLEPLRTDERAPLARAHPLALAAAALAVMLAAFVSRSVVAEALLLAAVALAVPLLGLPAAALARRAAPAALAALAFGAFNALVTGDGAAGASVALRIAAVAGAGILALAATDPAELADALIEHLHVPRRFAVGALAAFRLAPLLAREWERLALARRARGEDVTGFVSALRSFPGRTHGLLVGAIRRATDLALALDARGFGAGPCRTATRPRPFAARDAALTAGAAAAAAAALAAGLGAPF